MSETQTQGIEEAVANYYRQGGKDQNWGDVNAFRAGYTAALRDNEAVGWQPIETAPKEEYVHFLVLIPGNDATKELVIQVTWFEGWMYPDHLDLCINWDDRVTKATHWMPRTLP